MAVILEANNLTKNFSDKTVLDSLTFSVPEGRIVGLLGPNGSGKTTLMKLIAGLLTPTEGELTVCDLPVGQDTKLTVSYLPDRTYLSDSMKVSDTIKMFSDFYQDFDEEKALQLLETLNIETDKTIKTLSKGTKEKLQLVLVMSRNASLYILDEPIGGVDPAARDLILETIVKKHSENSTILISTHLIHDVEPFIDDAIFLNEGHIAEIGSVASIKEKYGMSLDDTFRKVFRC